MNRRSVSLVAVLVAITFLTGCAVAAGAAAGVGTYAWSTGKLSFTTPNSVSQTKDATLAAFNELDIITTKQKVDDLGGTIKGKTARGKTVTVDLQPVSLANVTEIEIRVGFFGDRAASERIADAIKQNL
jgi:hypothetical protein